MRRKPMTITGRTSSITNSFVQAIIPRKVPTNEELAEALKVLGMMVVNRSCSYCGTPATDWDHLRPLVRNRRPTGYIDEIRNLVPACGTCNQSKGASDWRHWINGNAKGSPRSRGVADLAARIERLENFEKWGDVQPLPLENWAGPELWNQHWENLVAVEREMLRAQEHAAKLRQAIAAGWANHQVERPQA